MTRSSWFTAAVAAGLALSLPGCLSPSVPSDSGGPFAEECGAYPGNDWWEVEAFVQERWAPTGPPGTPTSTLGVIALRNTTGTPWEDSWGPAIDWSWYAPADRPALIEDLVCLSIWRILNIPTLTPQPFWTNLGFSRNVSDAAFDALRAETHRQNEEFEDCTFFILFQDRRFGVEERPVHITPVFKPSSVRIGEVAPPRSDSRDDLRDAFIELANTADAEANISGWYVMGDAAKYTFGNGSGIAPKGTLRLHTGAGEDNATDLFWNREQRVWSDGVKAMLWDNHDDLIDMIAVRDPATKRLCPQSASPDQ